MGGGGEGAVWGAGAWSEGDILWQASPFPGNDLNESSELVGSWAGTVGWTERSSTLAAWVGTGFIVTGMAIEVEGKEASVISTCIVLAGSTGVAAAEGDVRETVVGRLVEACAGVGGEIPCNSNFFRSNWAIKVWSSEIVSATSDGELVRRW